MARVIKRIAGSGSGGAFAAGDLFKLTPHVQPIKDDLDLLMLGVMGRNMFCGGSDTLGIPAESTGDVNLEGWVPISVDNTSNQLSSFTDANGATLVVRMRYLVRVSNVGITVTPKIVYGTTIAGLSSVVTISGQAACFATSDLYTGTNQYQTVLITLPSGANLLKAVLTIGGTPAAGYQVWGKAVYDCFIQS